MKAKYANITQDYLRSILEYDPATGVFTWRARSADMFPHESPRRSSANQAACWNTRYAGRPAGILGNHGYLMIRAPRPKPAHRLAWFYVHGSWPSEEIDHVNGVTTDNRLCNLREATSAENQMNRPHRKDNVLGVRGVRPHSGRFVASIQFRRKQIHLGMFATIDDAKAAYDAAARNLYGEFVRD